MTVVCVVEVETVVAVLGSSKVVVTVVVAEFAVVSCALSDVVAGRVVHAANVIHNATDSNSDKHFLNFIVTPPCIQYIVFRVKKQEIKYALPCGKACRMG